MREFDNRGFDLAKAQARLFAQSINAYKGSSAAFVKFFMNSSSCESVDRLLQFNIDDILYELSKCKLINKGNKKYNYDVMYWVGYLYRIWSYVYEQTSKSIYKIIKLDELAKLYEPYHTLDTLQAIDRIIEAKNIKPKLSQVELYKKMFF